MIDHVRARTPSSLFFSLATSIPLVALLGACGSTPESGALAGGDAGPDVLPSLDAAPSDASPPLDGAAVDGAPSDAAPVDVAPAGHPARYATKVVSFTQGDGGGFGADKLPDIVLGPPHGGGLDSGSTDVLSLGNGGEVVVGFDVAVIDGPGVDFIVFENAFRIGGSSTNLFAEPGEVSVSDDGKTWTTYPCTATTSPYGACAGWHPVLATPAEPVDVTHPELAGGDAFDLADVGVKSFRFLRVRDMMAKRPATGGTAGFDLDAVAVVHGDPSP